MGSCLSTHYEQYNEDDIRYKIKCIGLIPMMIIDIDEPHKLKSRPQHIIRS